MKIIGIRIHDGRGELFMSPVEVMRGVKDGWFPFGNYSEPIIQNGRWFINVKPKDDGLYNVFSEWPRISIVGIVGKNGSGKSSLLEYLLMILNNAACSLLHDQYAKDEQQPVLAHGLYAELYFETDGLIRQLRCNNTDVFYNAGNQEQELSALDQYDRYSIATELFYLVMCNYGSYSLNYNDYVSRTKTTGLVSKVNGNWLQNIFQLEQNYIFPVTITPPRNDGNIDVNQLKEDAVEKLITLMLFAQSRGYQFMPGYELSRFKYEYNPSIRRSLSERILVTAVRKEIDKNGLMFVAAAMVQGWAQRLGCEDLNYVEPTDKGEIESHEVFKALLEFAGYNTVLLCAYYDKFRSRFDVIEYVKWHQRTKEPYGQGVIKEIDKENLFDVVLYDHSNLTYGIRKCLRTLQEAIKTGITNHPYFVRRKSRQSCEFKLNGSFTLEDILFLLPPPVYKLDAMLVKDRASKEDELFSIENKDSREIQLSKLSSGEKQFLYSMTSALFHIKSMDESIAFSKNISFHNLCLVFDEAELYFHPEYQQYFVFNLLHYVSWLKLSQIKSVQVVIATHSPFILSDILKDNILFMRDGQDYRVTMSVEEAKEFNNFGTFGANYYDLLRNGFFLKEQPIGKFASIKLEEYLQRIKANNIDDGLIKQIELVADPVIKGYLLYEIEQTKKEGYVQD